MTQHTENTKHSGLRIERTRKHGRAALIGGLALMMLTLGASEAWAQGARRGNGNGNRTAVLGPRVAQALRLTPAQVNQIQQLQSRMRQATADERTQLRQVNAQIRQARLAPYNNVQQLQSLYTQAQSLRSSLYAQQFRFRTAVYNVLNPQQRARLNSIIQRQRAIAHARQNRSNTANRNLPTMPSQGGTLQGQK